MTMFKEVIDVLETAAPPVKQRKPNGRWQGPLAWCMQQNDRFAPSLAPELRSYSWEDNSAMLRLPDDILVKIFEYIDYNEIAISLRLVCKKFAAISGRALLQGFRKLQLYITATQRHLQGALTSAKSPRETLRLLRIMNAMEVISAQYRLLDAVCWRSVCPRFGAPRMVFYGGRVLDTLYSTISRAAAGLSPRKEGPCPTITEDVGDAYCIRYQWQEDADDDSSVKFREIRELLLMCKCFADNFEYHEMRFNHSCAVSGSKMADLLDCLVEGQTGSDSRNVGSGLCTVRKTYHLQYSWLLTVGSEGCKYVANSSPPRFPEEQRLMYLRVRRLVAAYNELLLDEMHYERVAVWDLPDQIPIPMPSVYSGYSTHGERCYCYGSMNEQCFFMKIAEDLFEQQDEDIRGWEVVDFTRTLCSGRPVYLKIVVNVQCPLELAPASVSRNHQYSFEDQCAIIKSRVERRRRTFPDHESKFELSLSALSVSTGGEKCFEFVVKSPQKNKRKRTLQWE